jgi:hypothetical protein
VKYVPRSPPPHNIKRQFTWRPAARRYMEEVMMAAMASLKGVSNDLENAENR